MRSIIATLLMITFGLQLVGQNFVRSTTITTAGDTLKGYIDYGDWDVHPSKILYAKSVGSDKLTEYTPTDIKSFNLGKKEFIGATVTLKNELNEQRVESIFMETIVFGVKPLYFFKDQYGVKRFYILNEANELTLLVYDEKVKTYNDGMEVKIKNNLYQDQLIGYFTGCGNISRQVNSSSYTISSLTKLFAEYYNCSREAVGYITKPDKTSIEWKALIGASATKVNLNVTRDAGFEFLRGAFLPFSFRPTAGLAANIVLPRAGRKWSIYNEVNYSTFGINYISSRETPQSNVNYISRFMPHYIKLLNMIEYKTKADKDIFAHFAFGLSTARHVGGENYKKSDFKTSPDGPKVIEGPLVDPIRKFERGIAASAQLSKGKLALRYTYNRTLGFSPFSTLGAAVNWHYFTLHYDLN